MTLSSPEAEGTVLIIDDDEAMRQAVGRLLRSVGFDVLLFASIPEFLATSLPDAVSCLVLDVRLRGQSGLELQRRLVEMKSPLPIIFITGHADVPMCVQAMKSGAVEFLLKPFREQELLEAVAMALARDRARRTTDERSSAPQPESLSLAPPDLRVSPPKRISIGHLSLATYNRELTGQGFSVRLGDRAFNILCVLAERPDTVVPSRELVARVWPDAVVCDTALRVHITALRRAFERAKGPKVQIVNAAGRGYMLTIEDTANGRGEPRSTKARLS